MYSPYGSKPSTLTSILRTEELVELFTDCLIDGPTKHQERLKAIKDSSSSWKKFLTHKYATRKVTCFTKQRVLEIAETYRTEIAVYNNQVRTKQEHLKSLISDTKSQASKVQSEIAATMRLRNAQGELLPHQQALIDTFTEQYHKLFDHEKNIQSRLNGLATKEIHKYEKNLITTRNNCSYAYVPFIKEPVQIEMDVLPPTSEFSKCFVYDPQHKTTNLPLTLFYLLEYSNHHLLSEEILFSLILQYLQQYKEDLFFRFSQCKTLHELFLALLQLVDNQDDLQRISKLLQKFKREPGEDFATTISKFLALYRQHLQLLRPTMADSLQKLSVEILDRVVIFLVSPELAKQYSHFKLDCLKTGRNLSIDNITKFVVELELDEKYRTNSTLLLPDILGFSLPTARSDSTSASSIAAQPSTPTTAPPTPATAAPAPPPATALALSSDSHKYKDRGDRQNDRRDNDNQERRRHSSRSRNNDDYRRYDRSASRDRPPTPFRSRTSSPSPRRFRDDRDRSFRRTSSRSFSPHNRYRNHSRSQSPYRRPPSRDYGEHWRRRSPSPGYSFRRRSSSDTRNQSYRDRSRSPARDYPDSTSQRRFPRRSSRDWSHDRARPRFQRSPSPQYRSNSTSSQDSRGSSYSNYSGYYTDKSLNY